MPSRRNRRPPGNAILTFPRWSIFLVIAVGIFIAGTISGKWIHARSSPRTDSASNSQFAAEARSILTDTTSAAHVIAIHARNAEVARNANDSTSALIAEAKMGFDYGKVSDAVASFAEIKSRIQKLPHPGPELIAVRDGLIESILVAERLSVVQEWGSSPPSHAEMNAAKRAATELLEIVSRIDLMLPKSQ